MPGQPCDRRANKYTGDRAVWCASRDLIVEGGRCLREIRCFGSTTRLSGSRDRDSPPAVDHLQFSNLFRYLKSSIIICNFDRLEIVKSKVEQPAGIPILRVVAVQDDGNQCRIALSGTIDQCVEGDGGITGFAAEDVWTVVLRPVL